MIKFRLNGEIFPIMVILKSSLLNFLRNDQFITSVKDGCSGQAVCGACLVEIMEKQNFHVQLKLKNLMTAEIITLEGVPEKIKTCVG